MFNVTKPPHNSIFYSLLNQLSASTSSYIMCYGIHVMTKELILSLLTHLPACCFACLSTRLPVESHPHTHLPAIYKLSTNLTAFLPMHPPAHRPTHLPRNPPTHPPSIQFVVKIDTSGLKQPLDAAWFLVSASISSHWYVFLV